MFNELVLQQKFSTSALKISFSLHWTPVFTGKILLVIFLSFMYIPIIFFGKRPGGFGWDIFLLLELIVTLQLILFLVFCFSGEGIAFP